MWDVAVIGAGLSGLICARELSQAGQRVCLLDKSRGLGGRIATRRAHQVRIDHGLRYWKSSAVLAPLIDELLAANVLQPWPVSVYEILQREVITPIKTDESTPIYAAPEGMSAVGKYLVKDFVRDQNLLLEHRAIAIDPIVKDSVEGWQIECENGQKIAAKKCAIAIPAPQAAHLLKTYAADSLSDPTATISQAIQSLKAVDYWPSLTVMAGYDEQYSHDMGELDPSGWMVTDKAGTSTEWVGLDSSKRTGFQKGQSQEGQAQKASGPVIVIHAQGTFAQRYIDATDLQPAASVLLRASARKFSTWMAQPDWFQVHRWRYAFVNVGYTKTALEIERSLICGGDWCVGSTPLTKNIEAAYLSGLAMAKKLEK
ncbi:MAG: hypothetical protein DCF25_00040 [Leptolyngbya foveolarum]|uniref:Amine oxidase domain-containing protein n=1 Tax=Leptolyngbya foveolarum TaxID=47253 RepID=A0A2W4WMB5_9CYAN|nr:MAG: hypothetical protein DCF25_00040 [Leptolyngbya foveolarum]